MCENVIIKNFTTRYSIKDFTLGFVNEVNATEGYFTFKVQDGYPLLLSDEFIKKYSRRGWAWGSMYCRMDFSRPTNFYNRGIWKNQNQTHLFSMDYLSDNFKVANSYFGVQRVRSIVVRSRNGIIENNTFDNSNIGIWIGNEAGNFHEGPIPQNIIIRNNVFKNIWRNCVLISAANSQKNFVE